MIHTMLLFGATGDLTGRLLLPALASLHAAGYLPPDFRLVASSRQEWDDDQFRQHMEKRLDQHAVNVPVASRMALINATSHIYGDVSNPDSVATVLQAATDGGQQPIITYLALPQGLFSPLSKTIGDIGLPQGSRLVIEKPFGENLDDAVELNQVMEPFIHIMGEDSVYRVDHVLGMAPVQNLIGLRFANLALESLWNSNVIEQVDVLWEETMALEGRATFYDKAGALKDVLQNHMMQVLCYAAMEAPMSLDANDLQNAKVELLNAIRPLTEDDVINKTRRARYTAGTLVVSEDSDGREVPNYTDEDGVDAARQTETFAEIVLEVDNERWRGTRFVLRTGKALPERRKEIVLHFRPGDHPLFQTKGDDGMPLQPNVLRIGIDGPLDIALNLNTTTGESPDEIAPMTMASPPVTSDLLPYAWVLLDILSGGSGRSVRGDEAEAAWRVVMPILEAWEKGLVPMGEYRAGSPGPAQF